MQEKVRLEALLPDGWEDDFTTFFALDGGVLMTLLAFCSACSVDGVQRRDNQYTPRSSLDPLETSIGFHLRDWWHPDLAGFFAHLKKAQIAEALSEAGLPDAALDVEKMKKGDAGCYASQALTDTRWVPAWLKAPEPKADPEVDCAVAEIPVDNADTSPALAA